MRLADKKSRAVLKILSIGWYSKKVAKNDWQIWVNVTVVLPVEKSSVRVHSAIIQAKLDGLLF